MSKDQENQSIFRVFVRWRGQRKWSEVSDVDDYSLRRALEKCEIDSYKVELKALEDWR
jgi:hypothetical protein